MTGIIDETARQILFGAARTHSKFQAKPVAEDLLRQAWDLARMGPTSVNCQPARIVFVRSVEAKERLRPALAPGNLDKTMAAPVTAIIGHDMEFYEKLPTLFPHADARAWFVGNEAMIQGTAFRNGTLQGAYFILALRGLGVESHDVVTRQAESADRCLRLQATMGSVPVVAVQPSRHLLGALF